MTPRSFVVAVSALALLAGAGIVMIALAFFTGGEEAAGTSVVVVSPTLTVAPATPTPSPEPRTPRPPAPTTIGAAAKPTLTPTVPAPSPTSTPLATATPPPAPTASPAPPGPPPPPPGPPPPPPPALEPPDLVVLNLTVSGDRVSAVIGNVGGQAVPPGTTVQLALRGALAGSSTLPQGLVAGGNFTILLAEEFVYRQESVTAVVDPNNLVPEANETNNSLTRQLEPDILLDLALTGLNTAGTDEHLLVSVRNNSQVPARQVSARLSIYRSGSEGSLLSATVHQLDLEVQGAITLAPGIFAVRGLSLRVVLEVTGIVDGNPANNVLDSLIP